MMDIFTDMFVLNIIKLGNIIIIIFWQIRRIIFQDLGLCYWRISPTSPFLFYWLK